MTNENYLHGTRILVVKMLWRRPKSMSLVMKNSNKFFSITVAVFPFICPHSYWKPIIFLPVIFKLSINDLKLILYNLISSSMYWKCVWGAILSHPSSLLSTGSAECLHLSSTMFYWEPLHPWLSSTVWNSWPWSLRQNVALSPRVLENLN